MSTPGDASAAIAREWRGQILLFWVLATALPLTLLFNQELWLQSSYTGGLFHRQGFLDLYLTGIFRYRVLGRVLLLKLNSLILHFVGAKPYPMPRDAEGELSFVMAYAVLNGACLLLWNLVLLVVLWARKRGLRPEALPLYFFTLLLAGLSLSVVTPYDQLAYLLLMVAVLGALVRPAPLSYGLVALSAIAGMLNRETEFLATALLVTAGVFCQAMRRRRMFALAAVHLGLCLAVYVLLRRLLPGQPALTSIPVFGGKWAAPAAVVDVLVLAAGLVLAQRIRPSWSPALVFLVLSLPYLIPVVITGVLREIRLVVPLVLCLLCLYVLLERFKTRPLPGTSLR